MTVQIPKDWDTVLVNSSLDLKIDTKYTRKRKRKQDKSDKSLHENTQKKQSHGFRSNKEQFIAEKQTHNKHDVIDQNIKSVINDTHKQLIIGGVDWALQNQDQAQDNIQKMTTLVSKNLLSVMSSTNYKNVLKSTGEENIIYTNDIKLVTKRYEETYMRQKILEHENDCICKNNCECMYIDPSSPFIGVEYQLPWGNPHKNVVCAYCVCGLVHKRYFMI